MEIFDNILRSIFMISSRAVAMLIFCWPLKRRKYFYIRLLCPIAVCTALELFLSYPENIYIQFAINFLIVIALSLTVWLCFKEKYFNVLYCCVAGKCMMHLAESVGRVLFLQLGAANTYISFAIYAVIYLIVYFMFGRRVKSEEMVAIDKWKTTLFAFIVILVSDLLIAYFSGIARDVRLRTVIYLMNIIICFVTLCLQFGLLTESKMKIEAAVINQLRIKEQEQYAMSQDTINLINIKYHDIKNMIDSHRGKFSDAEMDGLKQVIDSYNIAFRTGNHTLDTVLTEKYIACKNMNIRLECMVNGNPLGFMKDMDIYSLYLNALNNAIESADKVQSEDKRVVWLKTNAQGSLLTIQVQNYYVDEPVFTHGKLISTTKADKRYHGYGLQSMKMIVTAYGGTMSLKAENKLFSLGIVIPIP